MLHRMWTSCQIFEKRMLIDYDVDNAKHVSSIIYQSSWTVSIKSYYPKCKTKKVYMIYRKIILLCENVLFIFHILSIKSQQIVRNCLYSISILCYHKYLFLIQFGIASYTAQLCLKRNNVSKQFVIITISCGETIEYGSHISIYHIGATLNIFIPPCKFFW